MSGFIITQFRVGEYQTNCYIILETASNECLIVDPTQETEFIIDQIQKIKGIPKGIILTHGHFDHMLEVFALEKLLDVDTWMSQKDESIKDRMKQTAEHFLGHVVIAVPPQRLKWMNDIQKIPLGSSYVEIIETPGHTPGGISIVIPTIGIIVGDLMFHEGIVGRTDFSYSDKKQLALSIKKILTYPDDYILYPGHGRLTTVGFERAFHENI